MGPTISLEAARAARRAKLSYVAETRGGLGRRRRGKHFAYHDAHGRPIRDAKTLARIKSLAIPPAWTDVWICPRADGHIQATGRDARGRKQYRYHPRWREHRDESKFGQLLAFGRALERVRAQVQADLGRRELCREKVVAAIVRLLECTLIRIGNDEYARANQSYGLTTLLDDHVELGPATVHFEFRGKSGVERRLTIKDAQLARVVKRCQDLPGQTLFQYVDAAGKRHRVGSADVNAYLRAASGLDLTAKNYRTWGGTLHVMGALGKQPAPASERDAKATTVAAIKAAALELGNTVAVCRKYYVHPVILDEYAKGKLHERMRRLGIDEGVCGRLDHSPAEKLLLGILTRAEKEKKPRRKAA